VKAPTDEQLLREFINGEAASFELLVRRHSAELYQFVLRFTKSAVAAEDVAQDAFLQVFTAAPTFDTNRRFKPWLFTIAANKARDYLRSRGRKREVPIDAYVDGGNDEDAGRRFLDLMAVEGEPIDEGLQLEEKREMVRRIMDDMPPKLSEVMILAYYHRFSYKEIAEVVGIPLGTVKSRLHAAVAAFAERYEAAAKARLDGAEQEDE
jgi:RNA polymerase sigma-70 factor (ECF subfamily)